MSQVYHKARRVSQSEQRRRSLDSAVLAACGHRVKGISQLIDDQDDPSASSGGTCRFAGVCALGSSWYERRGVSGLRWRWRSRRAEYRNPFCDIQL